LPRIDDAYLHSVVYLYRSRHEAEEGINIGGSGFLISVPSEIRPAPASHIYAVTNSHVIESNGCVARMNAKGGTTDSIEFRKSEWLCAKADDLAIAMLPPEILNRFLISPIPAEAAITREFVDRYYIGAGDDVIVLGRFINQEGRQRNEPSARFGFISQMPSEPIEYDGREQDSFLCEVKSIGGYSGSPVFVNPDLNSHRRGHAFPKAGQLILLGVDWCHIQNWHSARDDNGYEIPHIRVPENTGMMGVIPGWKLTDLINTPEAKMGRKIVDEREPKRRVEANVALDAAEASPPAIGENPTHQEISRVL
jgi:hypothetical protein